MWAVKTFLGVFGVCLGPKLDPNVRSPSLQGPFRGEYVSLILLDSGR